MILVGDKIAYMDDTWTVVEFQDLPTFYGEEIIVERYVVLDNPGYTAVALLADVRQLQ